MNARITVTLTDEQEAVARRAMEEHGFDTMEAVLAHGLDRLRWEQADHDENPIDPEFVTMLRERMNGPFISEDEFWERYRQGRQLLRRERGLET
ncbi:hypothetical protein [Jannaschia sp. LMIT008]|uniref:hypothetical protein n=1 Tax=Jannaschia maritima TaxID=3032585 RepID=UPI0028124C19|nr:hypothetical protein [Jannaschia sp. LMIT008]